MSEQSPKNIEDSYRDQPILDYTERLLNEVPEDTPPKIRLPEGEIPKHIDLRSTEIDVAYKNALFSQEYKDTLSRPRLVVKLGRKALNIVGVTSPGQKALRYHEGIIEHYLSDLGVEGNDISTISQEDHVAAREEKIEAELQAGEITSQTYAGMIEDLNPEAAAFQEHSKDRITVLKALAEYGSMDELNKRIDEVISLERSLALTDGRRLTSEEKNSIRLRMLQQSLAEDRARQEIFTALK